MFSFAHCSMFRILNFIYFFFLASIKPNCGLFSFVVFWRHIHYFVSTIDCKVFFNCAICLFCKVPRMNEKEYKSQLQAFHLIFLKYLKSLLINIVYYLVNLSFNYLFSQIFVDGTSVIFFSKAMISLFFLVFVFSLCLFFWL